MDYPSIQLELTKLEIKKQAKKISDVIQWLDTANVIQINESDPIERLDFICCSVEQTLQVKFGQYHYESIETIVSELKQDLIKYSLCSRP